MAPRELTVEHTLADHHLESKVVAHCDACRHVARLDTWSLGLRLGWDAPMREVEGRLRCTACGSKRCRLTVQPWRSRR